MIKNQKIQLLPKLRLSVFVLVFVWFLPAIAQITRNNINNTSAEINLTNLKRGAYILILDGILKHKLVW